MNELLRRPGQQARVGLGRILRAESAVFVEILKIADFLRTIFLSLLNKK